MADPKYTFQLEYAGVIGTSIVIWLLISVVFKSSREDLPAIRSKEFATVGFNNIGRKCILVS